MLVKITQKHIDVGTRLSWRHCPAALALLDAFPGSIKACVGTYAMSVCSEYNFRTYDTPPAVREFILAFDEGKPVSPMEFTL